MGHGWKLEGHDMFFHLGKGFASITGCWQLYRLSGRGPPKKTKRRSSENGGRFFVLKEAPPKALTWTLVRRVGRFGGLWLLQISVVCYLKCSFFEQI